jgi:exopolysaccharide biosynthesis polyprenyl glycosylphosphotransferase
MGTSDLSRDIANASAQQLETFTSIPGTVEEQSAGEVDEHATRILETTPPAKPCRRRLMAARGSLLLYCDAVALTLLALLVGQRWLAVAYSAAVLLALNILGRHRLRICMRVSDEVPRLAAAAALPLLVLVPWQSSLARLLIVGAVTTTVLIAMRAALYASLRAAYRANWLTEPALIVGTGDLGCEVAELLQAHSDLGLRPVGLVGETTQTSGRSLPVLGGFSRVADLVRQYGVSKIIVSLPSGVDEGMVSALRAGGTSPADVYVIPAVHEIASAIPASCMDEIWGIPLVPLRRSGLEVFGRIVKRVFDVVVGAALLVVLGPVLLILAALGFLGRIRPVMFRQDRVTRSGRIITIMKFRTMNCPNPDSQWAVSEENCSTLGRLLRATHLDELPQLFNVIRGDMSLVGPRPERPFFTARFAETVPHYNERHRTRTGLTGWAQVHGLTGDTSIPERVRFDNYYIEHWSFWLDLVIMARTVGEPLVGALRSRQAYGQPPEAGR